MPSKAYFYGADRGRDSIASKAPNVWLTVGLREGKNREVKKVLVLPRTFEGQSPESASPMARSSWANCWHLARFSEIRGRTLRDQLGENG